MEKKEIQIRSNSELKDWLSSNSWFEDGYVINLWPFPTSRVDACPEAVCLELAYQIEGSYIAGALRTLQVYELRSFGTTTWWLENGTSYNPRNCIEEVEVLKTPEGIALEINVPGRLELRCSELVIRRLPDRTDINLPTLSKNEIYAKISLHAFPTPKDWASWFNAYGVPVGWRPYAGDAKEANQIPENEYDGWFLQTTERVSKHSGGILFISCKPEGDGFSVSLRNTDDEDLTLWRLTKNIIALFQEVEVRCGNCWFTREQWIDYIRTGAVPFNQSI